MNPLCYQWAVKFIDGSELTQFDSEGNEHPWAEVQPRLRASISFEWRPFSPSESQRINQKGGNTASKGLRAFSIPITGTLRVFRRNFIDTKGNHRVVYAMGCDGDLIGIDESGNIVGEGDLR